MHGTFTNGGFGHFRVYGAEACHSYQVGKWLAYVAGEGARLLGYPQRFCVVDDFGNLVGV